MSPARLFGVGFCSACRPHRTQPQIVTGRVTYANRTTQRNLTYPFISRKINRGQLNLKSRIIFKKIYKNFIYKGIHTFGQIVFLDKWHLDKWLLDKWLLDKWHFWTYDVWTDDVGTNGIWTSVVAPECAWCITRTLKL